jgi:hypothetical protein
MAKNAAPKIEYIDVPGISETYADAVRGMMFDGQNVRLELCVTRMEEPQTGADQLTGKRQTACRVVLPLATALDLSSKLGRVLTTLAQRGAERKAKAQASQAQGAAKAS